MTHHNLQRMQSMQRVQSMQSIANGQGVISLAVFVWSCAELIPFREHSENQRIPFLRVMALA